MTRVLVLNGPNLGRLGSREPDVYGDMDFAALTSACEGWGKDLDLEVEVRQTDDETELVTWLHQAADAGTPVEIGRASCRERVEISVGAGSVKKKRRAGHVVVEGRD